MFHKQETSYKTSQNLKTASVTEFTSNVARVSEAKSNLSLSAQRFRGLVYNLKYTDLGTLHSSITEVQCPCPCNKVKLLDVNLGICTGYNLEESPGEYRDQKPHLNYYASTYNRGRQLLHRKKKLNQIRQKQACILN